jgi:hypothetical protein
MRGLNGYRPAYGRHLVDDHSPVDLHIAAQFARDANRWNAEREAFYSEQPETRATPIGSN